MRRWMWIVLAVAACKGGDKRAAPIAGSGSGSVTAPSNTTGLVSRLPAIDRDDVTAAPADTDEVPLLIFVETDGKVAIAEGPKRWSELAAFDPDPRALRPVDLDALGMLIREAVGLGTPTSQIARSVTLPAPRVAGPPDPKDDPLAGYTPPDDGSDDEGGTGTAIALDESGSFTKTVVAGHPRGRRDPSIADPNRMHPERVSQVVGAPSADRKLVTPQTSVIAARPDAPARALVDAVAETEGTILVANGDQVKPLRLQFVREAPTIAPFGERWIEVRVTRSELAVETVPDAPIVVPWTAPDPGGLAKAYQASNAKPKYARTAVDVLVANDVRAQQLIDVLVALDRAGAKAIALGSIPPPDHPDAKLRGKPFMKFVIGSLSTSGTFPYAPLRKALAASSAKLRACYETALAKKPALEGAVRIAFLFTPSGTVPRATASGVDPNVSDCMANVVKALEFPTSKSTVQAHLEILVAPSW